MLKTIYFNNPSQQALHFHDNQPNETTTPDDQDIAQMRQAMVEMYGAQSKQAAEQFCRTVTEEWLGDIRYLRIEPKTSQKALSNKAGIYLFGGGFFSGSPEIDLLLSAPLAYELGFTLLSPEYRLAPEYPFPAGLNDCVAFYRDAVANFGAANIVLLGESAGANLALVTMLRARQEGIALPCAMALLSPATDQSGNSFNPDYLFQDDPSLSPHLVNWVQQIYAPNMPVSDPFVSPHYAAYGSWCPPLLFTSGTRDVFQYQILKSAKKMGQASVDVTVHMWEGMWHVFEYYPTLPEATKSIKQIAKFLLGYIHS